jgi:hypothetical protein
MMAKVFPMSDNFLREEYHEMRADVRNLTGTYMRIEKVYMLLMVVLNLMAIGLRLAHLPLVFSLIPMGISFFMSIVWLFHARFYAQLESICNKLLLDFEKHGQVFPFLTHYFSGLDEMGLKKHKYRIIMMNSAQMPLSNLLVCVVLTMLLTMMSVV